MWIFIASTFSSYTKCVAWRKWYRNTLKKKRLDCENWDRINMRKRDRNRTSWKTKTFIFCLFRRFIQLVDSIFFFFRCCIPWIQRSIFAYAILRSYFVSCLILSFYLNSYYNRVYSMHTSTLHDSSIQATRSSLRFGIRNRIIYTITLCILYTGEWGLNSVF